MSDEKDKKGSGGLDVDDIIDNALERTGAKILVKLQPNSPGEKGDEEIDAMLAMLGLRKVGNPIVIDSKGVYERIRDEAKRTKKDAKTSEIKVGDVVIDVGSFGFDLADFIDGKVDIHAPNMKINGVTEWKVWLAALVTLKQNLGYTKPEAVEKFSRIKGYDENKTKQQIAAWWDKI